MSEELVKKESIEKKKKERLYLSLGIVFAVVVISLFVYSIAAGGNGKYKRLAENGIREGLAYNADEAEFSGMNETEFFFYGDNDEYCEVTGWVIAFNGYGVSSKVGYEVELEKNDSGEWEFYDFTLDE